MCDEGEKTCPLCAEEMDLTDQQLKPCQCGYQLCVWCWHHIMDMAEKDETEGRCPACRTPYDKEKIVGMATNCERIMAGISTEKKFKSQKAKSKASEGRKQLSNVRVIQKNLVYIVGLPLDLADEDVLQCKEYFGQYGKVLKVSMSRTSSGVIQQFPNNTCSVYITYSKEEEAIRCIQSVHGFTLDGRPLRACFGTTKYCHAWLRNVPCSNPDCLYLHEIGSPEDSFTKDEIISAYTRSRVQQITSNVNTMQRRSGNALPPPFDDYSISSSAIPGKPIVKNASNIAASMVKGSPPNGTTGRSAALPAAASWGIRASSCSTQATSLDSVKATSKPRFESLTVTSGQSNSSNPNVVRKPTLPSSNEKHNIVSNSKSEASSLNQHVVMAFETSSLEKCVQLGEHTTTVKGDGFSGVLSNKMPPEDANSLSNSKDMNSPCVESNLSLLNDEEIRDLSSDLLSLNIDNNHGWKNAGQHESLVADLCVSTAKGSQCLQKQSSCEKESVVSMGVQKYVSSNEVYLSSEKMKMADSEAEQDILSFDNQRLKDPEVVNRSNYLSDLASPLHVSNQFTAHSFQHDEMMNVNGLKADDHSFVNNMRNDNSLFHASMGPKIANGYAEHSAIHTSGLERTAKSSFMLPNESNFLQDGLCQNDLANAKRNGLSDSGESSIISNILSLDFDSWNNSLTSPENIAKFLGEKDNQQVSLKSSSCWKLQNSSQSRFSFARQEEPKCQSDDAAVPFGNFGQRPCNRSVGEDLYTERDSFLPSSGISNGLPLQNYEEAGDFTGSQFLLSSSRTGSRSQVSVPPGFTVPSKAPPPGFSFQERLDQAFENPSGNHLLETHTMLASSYQVQPTGNFGSPSDIEFMDPAILAVGKGRINNGFDSSGLDIRSLTQRRHAFESEPGLEFLMQRSLSLRPNLRYDIGAGYSSLNDSCAVSSRILDHSQIVNQSPFSQLSLQQGRSTLMSNGQWDGWNDIQVGNGLNVLRNERLGMNKYYNGFEDSSFCIPNSAGLYNRTFGM